MDFIGLDSWIKLDVSMAVPTEKVNLDFPGVRLREPVEMHKLAACGLVVF